MGTLRYVILHHQGIATPHYDLMFETRPGSALRTWRSPTWPIHDPVELTALADHRRDYLDYQGPLSENRGFVSRIETGTFRLLKMDETHFEIELESGPVVIQKTGEIWVITKLKK